MLNSFENMEILQLEYIDLEENDNYKKIIEKVVQECFYEEKVEELNMYISITLTTPTQIRKLNKEYRSIDKETDVLSFPMFEKSELETMTRKPISEPLGDIIISIKRVEEQAKEYGHSFERELSYMVVHGFYHLMGYDHIEEKDKIEMRKKEKNILNRLKIVRN